MAAAFAGVLDAALPAQQAPPPTPPAPRALLLQNLAPDARTELAAVVVPFARGAVQGRPDLHVDGQATDWQPFGARWPDGSLRQALCLFRTEMAALSEAVVTLKAGPGPDLPTGEVPLPTARITFAATIAGATTTAEPAPVAELEAGPLRRVQLRRARLGDTGLVAELIITACRDQAHAHADVAVFFSDPRLPAMQCNVEELAIVTQGMSLALRHGGRFGITHTATADGSRTVLLQRRPLGDGQGLRRTGALLPALSGDAKADATVRAAMVAPLLGATTWTESGSFGPYGVVPPPPPWLAGNNLRAYFARAHQQFVAGDRGGDPFAVLPIGLVRFAGQTGDQEDFGVVKLSLVASTGLPSQLLMVEAAVQQEACRPVHFYEADGSPVEPANHPDWVVWSGRTHWHGSVSKDRLGKPVPEPAFEAHGWTGKDQQHWSSLNLSAYALLTGSHWARAELANEARLYLAGQTLRADLSTSHSDAPRGAGRTALSAAWNYLATGNEALRTRMDARMDQVYLPEWPTRNAPSDQVRPYLVNAPDGRSLQGKYNFWNPWQDAIAAVGFGAHHQVTGNPRARELAEALAINVVQHGWLLTPTVNEVGMAIRWLDGAPFTAEQWRSEDPTLVLWSQGTNFTEWSFGCVEIARNATATATNPALRQKCAEIQARLRANRRPPRDGGMDRFGEWDAVRWP